MAQRKQSSGQSGQGLSLLGDELWARHLDHLVSQGPRTIRASQGPLALTR